MSKQEKPQMIHNLEEFLAACGFADNEPSTWARCFYKDTDCGPWAAFYIKKKDAFTRQIQFAVGRNKAGRLAIVHDEENIGERDRLEPADVQRFGFEEDRTMRPSLARSLKQYRKLVENFAKEGSGYTQITVHPGEPYTGHPDRKRVWISAMEEIPAELERIPSEMIGRAVTKTRKTTCGCRLKTIGTHANDPREEVHGGCEPNPQCPRCQGRGTYEMELPTGRKYEVTNENCAGVEFGSIVEGSDACSGPFRHIFAFDMVDFARDVQTMEKETSFYWERDNSIWLHAREIEDHSNQYCLHNSWGKITWDLEKPKSRKLQRGLEKFCKNVEKGRTPGHYEPVPDIPGWEVAEIVNTTF
jgi:hypothetical protein